MSAIRDAGKIKARDRIAVLAALNLAYQLAERGERLPANAHDAHAASTGSAEPRPQAHPEVDLTPLIARLDAALDDGHLI
jgi:cell division protein ZapA